MDAASSSQKSVNVYLNTLRIDPQRQPTSVLNNTHKHCGGLSTLSKTLNKVGIIKEMTGPCFVNARIHPLFD
jgi:hypothetical protein